MAKNSVETIREDYDRLAAEYANRLFDELQHKPLDRELLDRFAAQMKGRGEVCDLACGPGQVARYLHDAKVSVFGLDLSPGMLEQARRLNPTIPCREGNMLSLDIASETLVGITAFYAIVNIPEQSLGVAFREIARVLKPSGLLLIAFHIGDEVVQMDELWGTPITMNFFLFKTAQIRKSLEAAGLVVDEVIERDPYPEVEYQSRRAYILARKPASRGK
jgi:ubiquinone/menaquinone biosynthesis C-methylase UbiE